MEYNDQNKCYPNSLVSFEFQPLDLVILYNYYNVTSVILVVALCLCPEGWQTATGGDLCYKFSSLRKTYEDADEACKMFGGSLATIKNPPNPARVSTSNN